jgi:hypothetical protein
MSDDPDEILDGLFHGCALAAFLEQAQAERGWPNPEATRQRAYELYEEALAEKNGRPKAIAPRPARQYALDP